VTLGSDDPPMFASSLRRSTGVPATSSGCAATSCWPSLWQASQRASPPPRSSAGWNPLSHWPETVPVADRRAREAIVGALVQWTVLSRPPSSELAAGQPDVQVVVDVDLDEPGQSRRLPHPGELLDQLLPRLVVRWRLRHRLSGACSLPHTACWT